MNIDKDIFNCLKTIYDYMNLNQKLEKCDLIIGCGCSNLDIPVRCAELFKQGYADKILFSGGKGKITSKTFEKTEAEIFREIAVANGVPEDEMILENESTNTGDNFRYSLKMLKEKEIKADKIIIVHGIFSQRRTLASAETILKCKKLYITSPNLSFEDYINQLSNEDINEFISVIVGDIQRIIIYPQFGWQTIQFVPNEILKCYEFLKDKGYTKYIFTKEDIQKMIDKYGILNNQEPNYFN